MLLLLDSILHHINVKFPLVFPSLSKEINFCKTPEERKGYLTLEVTKWWVFF